MTIGERIRALRERRGWTVRELARDAHVSPATVSKLERGQREPSIRIARQLARALGVTIDYLAGMYEDDIEEQQPAALARLGR